MKVVKPLEIPVVRRGWVSLFLAGSIEMGAAPQWQSFVAGYLNHFDRLLVMNPRRDDWDSSWEQSPDHDQFRWQVEWELRGMELADVVALYLDPGTKAPISLLELGLHARGGKVVACCPEGFWRRGNVQMLAETYPVELTATLDEFIEALRARVSLVREGKT